MLTTLAKSEKVIFHHIVGPTHEGLQGDHLYIHGRIPLTPEQSAMVKKLSKR